MRPAVQTAAWDFRRTRAWVALTFLAIASVGLTSLDALAQVAPAAVPEQSLESGGPIQLRQPNQIGRDTRHDSTRDNVRDRAAQPAEAAQPLAASAPSEFEVHVSRLVAPQVIRRFGAELMESQAGGLNMQDFNPLVPPDYAIQPGDELLLSLWGSVDADLRVVVDRSGRISVPRVGAIMVSGVRYAELSDTIGRRVSQVFRNYQLSVSLGQLRGVRVYVTGFVKRPGAVHVSSLSTVTGVLLAAGGPSAAGSMRTVQLRRGRESVATLDLYDLLITGDRSGDRVVQAEDVIHVGPIGPQVALVGSVNRPGIFELQPTETVSDVLRMAGGFSAVADRSRVYVERLSERMSTRVSELAMPAHGSAKLASGDVIRALSAVSLAQPLKLQNKRIRVEGEVARPGEFVLEAEATVSKALLAAGGLTSAAYVFGTELNRPSVQRTQLENYERALRDLESEIFRQTPAQRSLVAGEAGTLGSRVADGMKWLERLRALKPTGRIVLELAPDAREPPDLMLEDGDRIYVPPRSAAVGVFGSVYNTGSYLFSEGRAMEDYLRLAGGPTKGADTESTLVVRANGSVVSIRQREAGWFSATRSLGEVKVLAGDTIFVPEELGKTSSMQIAKDWTTIFYNLGLGVAAIKAVFN